MPRETCGGCGRCNPVPFAPISVDRVDIVDGLLTPADRVHPVVMEFSDFPRPAAQGHIREIRVPDAQFHANLVTDSELGRGR